mgnify:CR=1 FL=1
MKKYCYSIWGQYQCTFAKRILNHKRVLQRLPYGDTNIFDDSSETKNSKLFPDIYKCYLFIIIYLCV